LFFRTTKIIKTTTKIRTISDDKRITQTTSLFTTSKTLIKVIILKKNYYPNVIKRKINTFIKKNYLSQLK